MKNPYLMYFKPTDRWDSDKSNRQQESWDDHAEFIDSLLTERVILVGGPLADNSAIMMVVLAESGQAARDYFAEDPWITKGLVQIKAVHQWNLEINVWR